MNSMQNAELYRRGVVLPLDDDAERRIRSNEVNETTNVRHLRIVDDSEFDALWKIGIFHEINARCSTLLDDYEDELIDTVSVDGVIHAVDAVFRVASDGYPEAFEFLAGLRALASEASRLSRPLLFIL